MPAISRRSARHAVVTRAAVVVAIAALSGCAGSQADEADEADEAVNVRIEIADGTVSPDPGRTSVTTGQTVRIEITGDQPDTVHVHGYDVEADIDPPDPVVVEFVADQPGLFDVETHESGLLLTQLAVE